MNKGQSFSFTNQYILQKAVEILKIPLRWSNDKDKWVWSNTTDGRFTVKSAFGLTTRTDLFAGSWKNGLVRNFGTQKSIPIASSSGGLLWGTVCRWKRWWLKGTWREDKFCPLCVKRSFLLHRFLFLHILKTNLVYVHMVHLKASIARRWGTS